MPSVSKSQRRAIGLALHHPEKLHKKNRNLLSMSKADLHDFAAVSEKGLPIRAKKGKKGKNLLRP